MDARCRFNGRYEVSGSLDLSRVAGDAAAIALTQRDPVHLYQRPDGPLDFDPTRTSLSGINQEIRFAKVGGKRLHFETAYQWRTPGFEINDIGFLRQADQQQWTSWANLVFNQPNRIFQQLRWNFNNWEHWTSSGLPTERAFNTNVHIQFTNRWWLHMGGTLGQLGATYCDRCARGGPAIRQDPYLSPWIEIDGDDRRPLVPALSVNYTQGDGGRSETIEVSPELALKVSSRFTTSLGRRSTTTGTISSTSTRSRMRQASSTIPSRISTKDAHPDLAPGLYVHPDDLAPDLRFSVRLEGDLFRRARDAEARASEYDARYHPMAIPRSPMIPEGSTSSSSARTSCSAGNIVRARRCFWSGARDAKVSGRRRYQVVPRRPGRPFGRRADDAFLVKVSYWLTP